jgi:hypothetical protein
MPTTLPTKAATWTNIIRAALLIAKARFILWKVKNDS